MSKRTILICLLITLFFSVGLIGIMGSETGSRWLLKTAFASIPGDLAVEKIHGSLLSHISLAHIRYKSDTELVTVKEINLTWQPSHLFAKSIKIKAFSIVGLDIKINKTEEKPQEQAENDVNLPFKINIDNFSLTDTSIEYGDHNQHINKLQFAISTQDNQLKLTSLILDSDLIAAKANGKITLEKSLPINLNLDWRVSVGQNGFWQGLTELNGSLDNLIINSRLFSPFLMNLTGSVQTLRQNPKLNLKADWQNILWPVIGQPKKVQSPEGHITLVGSMNHYQLNVNGKLSQQYLPKTDLFINSTGSLEEISLNKLELKSSSGEFQLAGKVNWKDITTFGLSAKGQHFNPGILMPELPGSLDISGHINGRLDPVTPQITAEIKHINGQLRKQPVNAKGTFNLSGEKLKIDDFHVESGKNRLTINGNIDKKQSDLKLAMDMPQLAALWPNLAGNLSGNGRLEGGLDNPYVNLTLHGNSLRFNQVSAQTLALDVDYSPNLQKKSQISLTVNTLQSSSTKINKINIEGIGNINQHDFTTDLQSTYGNLAVALKGKLTGKQWQGEVNKLEATEPEGYLWTLNKNTKVQITKKADGIDVALDENCLAQQAAALCTKGLILANGDLNFWLYVKALPSRLLKPLLPGKTTVNTEIDGKLDIQSQNKTLKGAYRFTTSPAQILLETNDVTKALHFGASDIAGNINGDTIMADLNLNLSAQDYLRSKLSANIGKTQTLSGNIKTSINDFSMLQAFVPELSNVKGHLTVDISVSGSVKKPIFMGNANLVEGTLDMGQLGLREFNLHALTSGNRGNPVQLSGSAIPVILNKPDAKSKFEINSKINYEADISFLEKINGSFKLDFFPDTIISLTSPEKNGKIKLRTTNLSGTLNDSLLSTELAVALAEQDYLRGKLTAKLGDSASIEGQVNASIQRLQSIELFAPQLSKIKGLLKADLLLTGTKQKPLVNGTVSLNNGETEVNQLGITVRDINLHATSPTLNSDEVVLRGSAKSGEGHIKLDGLTNLKPEDDWPTRLTLSGTDFEVAKLPEAEVAVSPNLQFQSTGQLKKITGELNVPKAIFKIQDIPENAVKVSEDEIIIGEEKPAQETSLQPDVQADIEVILGKKISFTGQGLQTDLSGKLKIIKTNEKTAMQGNVDMKNASYKRFGQKLSVRRGKFVFNGPADNPWLDVQAIRLSKSKKVTAILSLDGTMQHPKTRIYSEPSLPEQEALAYLVTGGPLNRVSKSDSNMLASAALSFGAGKATWLADKLGIHEFDVEEGSTLEDTLLTMGQYLTPDFYLGAKVGMFNKQASLVLKHKITDTINVETQTGTSQRIKLNYEFDMD